MDKDDWKGFLRFLDEAREDELQARLEKARGILSLLKTPEVKSDARRLIRLLEQELLSRQGRVAPRQGSR